MFSYYGSKSSIVKYYPKPIYNTIIEPFAGSAAYSLEYWDRRILLIEKYDKIVKLWNYLKTTTPERLDSLPKLEGGKKFSTEGLSEEEIYLLGFMCNPGSSIPKKTAGTINLQTMNTIKFNLDKIKHWTIIEADYKESPDVECTWFIDPPYQNKGKYYRHFKIDYNELREFCLSRRGQVIVCENEGADWLPFRHLMDIKTINRKSSEVIWTNCGI